MRILLVSCYELGHQPVTLSWPAAFLKRDGFDVELADASVKPLEGDALRGLSIVGISVPMHTALRLGIQVAERVRRASPSAHICFYGLYATLNAEYLVSTVADSVLGGEYEENLVALVRSLASGREAAMGPSLSRLSFPVPSRESLPGLEHYAHLERDGARVKAGYVEASRGCLHTCRHCPIPPVYGGRFFVVPREVVLADVRNLVSAGAEHVTLGDPDFLNGPGHALAVARAIHAEFPRVTFDFTAKIEHLLGRRTVLPELSALGCVFAVSAVESLSNAVLANLKKGHTREDVFVATRLLREAGISLRPSFVSFTPWTTLEDYADILSWVEEDGLVDNVDPVQYSIRLLVPPGSSLVTEPAMKPFLGPLVRESLSYTWSHPDPRLDWLHLEVAELVEEAATRKEDPAATFARIVKLATGRRVTPLPKGRLRPPRLTEDWFC